MKRRLSTDVDDIRNKARAALASGHTVFTPTLRSSPTKTDDSDRFAEMIAAIEAEGWRLEHWALAGSPVTVACPVFRRG